MKRNITRIYISGFEDETGQTKKSMKTRTCGDVERERERERERVCNCIDE